MEHKTVIFVEYTREGELGNRLRELYNRLSGMLGFNIKVVERAGSTLRSQFPVTTLWDGAPCPREECIMCSQGAETIQPCTRTSAPYENICKACNPGVGSKEEPKELRGDIPTVYVGETSRSVQEHAMEHWQAYRTGWKTVT